MGVYYMKKLTYEFNLQEFDEYCKQNDFYRFIFSDENQNDICGGYTWLWYTITFYHMEIIPDTCRVFVYNDNVDDVSYEQCCIDFCPVKHIRVEEVDDSGFFCEMTLYCGEDEGRNSIREYKLVAQKNI